MSHKTTRSKPFKTPICRFSFVQNMFNRVSVLDKAGKPIIGKDGKPLTEQQCTLIFPLATPKDAFKAAIIEACTASSWGEKSHEYLKANMIRLPFIAGDGKEARNKKTMDLHPGMGPDVWFIRVATRLEALVRYKHENIPATFGTGPDQIKSGDYGFAALSAYTWEHEANGMGVSFGIDFLQKTKDGEALGGTGPSVQASDFYEKVGTESLGGASASALFS